jgi:hypothetical protein
MDLLRVGTLGLRMVVLMVAYWVVLWDFSMVESMALRMEQNWVDSTAQ